MPSRYSIEDIIDISAEGTVSILAALFADGILGSFVPGLASIFMSYRQKKSEKMFHDFQRKLMHRIYEIEMILSSLPQDDKRERITKSFEIILNTVANESQEEKLDYIANGFVNFLSAKNFNDHKILLYYDLINELRISDLMILRLFYDGYHELKKRESYEQVIHSLGLSDHEFLIVRSKLVSKNLITNIKEPKDVTVASHKMAIRWQLDESMKLIYKKFASSSDQQYVHLHEHYMECLSKQINALHNNSKELPSYEKATIDARDEIDTYMRNMYNNRRQEIWNLYEPCKPEKKLGKYHTTDLGRSFLDYFAT